MFQLLKELTSVGNISYDAWEARFDEMKQCKDTYFVVVIEDIALNKVNTSITFRYIYKYFFANIILYLTKIELKITKPNIFLTQIYFCIPEIFKTNLKNRFLSTKLPIEFVFQFCKFTRVLSSQKAGVKCSYTKYIVFFFVCMIYTFQWTNKVLFELFTFSTV